MSRELQNRLEDSVSIAVEVIFDTNHLLVAVLLRLCKTSVESARRFFITIFPIESCHSSRELKFN
jgi:hypothetical protein